MTKRRQVLRSQEPLATFFFLSLILIISFAFPSVVLRAEPVSSGPDVAAGKARVAPDDMNSGALLLQGEDGTFVEAPRLQTDVVMTVNGTIARVAVTQRFENKSDRWVEGIYVFPLPQQSAVDALRMEIGDRVIEGEIKGREDAKKAYQAAKDAGQKASLVEQERPNIFTNSVANIGPHETIVVRIEYQETVKQDGGVYSLRFPLVVAPRYNPKANEVTTVDFGSKSAPIDPVPDRNRIAPPVLDPDKHPKINPVSIEVKLNSGFVLGEVKSSFHQITLNRTGDETATLSLASGTVPADKDFELTWSPKAAAVPQTALFHEIVNGQDYLLAMVTPPTLDASPTLLPRELIFVIDNSGSMAGESIIQAKQSLLLALDRLRAGDKFNVIRFDDTMETVFPLAVDATTENIAVAKHFVGRLDAQGGTEMLPALVAALKDATPGDTTRLRQVVFLTDGSVGNEAQLFDKIADQLGRSRLFTIGIGSAPNSYFMTRAAELGRGTFTHIGSDAQVLERMTALFAKLEKPVMIGLKAEWPSAASTEVWPDPLPDLYVGEPVVLSAKVNSMNGELRFSGMFDGKPWTAALRLSDAIDGAGVAKLWARSKIAALESKLYSPMGALGADHVAKQIETVALEHHLVSSETSLVAIDKSKSRPDGQGVATVDMPVNLPDGWVYDKVFGPSGGQQQMKAASYNRALTLDPSGYGVAPNPSPHFGYDNSAAPTASVAEVVPPVNPTQVPEAQGPDTATFGQSPPDPANAGENYPVLPLTVAPKPETNPLTALKSPSDSLRFAILALVLALLSAISLIVWRHHRRDYASPRRIGRRI
jgi:Ca-activated chloride channel family protein